MFWHAAYELFCKIFLNRFSAHGLYLSKTVDTGMHDLAYNKPIDEVLLASINTYM